jgi:serine protease Do
MTNAHVVEGADEVLVTLPDKREFKAKIVGFDKRTDVAVVKIEATGLPAVKVGDITRLKVGEWVMAIGSPFGLENTVTAGIVSAKQRDTGDYLPFIQTDVAINPGNSGGPLINMRGEVVGINSQIYSRSGGFMGISFAIPIDEAIRVSEQLRTSGRVSRGKIGVQIDQVTKDVAESIGLGKPMGALVRSVESGSPADKAGVEAGDIITKFDGKVIDKASDLPRLVGNTKPGARSSMTVFRRGGSRDLSVTVAEIEPEKPVIRTAEKEEKPKGSVAAQAIGLVVSELTDAEKGAQDQGRREGRGVTDSAARAGIREGRHHRCRRQHRYRHRQGVRCRGGQGGQEQTRSGAAAQGRIGHIPADPSGALKRYFQERKNPSRGRVWGFFGGVEKKNTGRQKIFFGASRGVHMFAIANLWMG